MRLVYTEDVKRVTVAEARDRLITFRDGKVGMATRYHYPSALAAIIWPGHRMRQQGAAFAAVGVLRRLGVRWGTNGKSGGYFLGDLR